jgi:hypothetical protein
MGACCGATSTSGNRRRRCVCPGRRTGGRGELRGGDRSENEFDVVLYRRMEPRRLTACGVPSMPRGKCASFCRPAGRAIWIDGLIEPRNAEKSTSEGGTTPERGQFEGHICSPLFAHLLLPHGVWPNHATDARFCELSPALPRQKQNRTGSARGEGGGRSGSNRACHNGASRFSARRREIRGGIETYVLAGHEARL